MNDNYNIFVLVTKQTLTDYIHTMLIKSLNVNKLSLLLFVYNFVVVPHSFRFREVVWFGIFHKNFVKFFVSMMKHRDHGWMGSS